MERGEGYIGGIKGYKEDGEKKKVRNEVEYSVG